MPVAIILAAVVILGGVVVVAMGRGGELARERPHVPASSEFRTWSDVANYRPPAALLGYHARTTEHALSLIARTIAERDAEIDWLRKRLAEARPEFGPYDPAEDDDGPIGDTHPATDASSTGQPGPAGQDVRTDGDWPHGTGEPTAARAAAPPPGFGGRIGADG